MKKMPTRFKTKPTRKFNQKPSSEVIEGLQKEIGARYPSLSPTEVRQKIIRLLRKGRTSLYKSSWRSRIEQAKAQKNR